MMERLVSSWFTSKTLPETYVFPAGKRPGEHVIPACRTLPVIDLKKAYDNCFDRMDTVHEIMKACQDYGFFQVVNHGVQSKLMDETMDVFKEFFQLPAEDKLSLLSDDPNQNCRLYTSSYNYDKEQVHYWRDALKHSCSPLEECIQYWPEKPTRYRQVVGAFCVEVRELGSGILELICEGLGLERGYLANELSGDSFLTVNHYPPCPNPSLTLGLSKHCDPNLITILLQGDVPGLQVFKDGEWIGVEPLPHAFVVNVGYLLHIVSNGKLKSAEHRAVTNADTARTSAAIFINGSKDCVVEPAKALVSEDNPPLFKAVTYGEFFQAYAANTGDTEIVLQALKIKS
ncbi:hypothetical protein Ancab_022433 [Ancistrocladus abbreviatus]